MMIIWSPLMPARAAPAGWTETTMTPAGFRAVAPLMPSAAWPLFATLPALISQLDGVDERAKPIPLAAEPPSSGSVAARVGMPMTRPWVSTRAPPLLPGLMAALVWTVSGRTTRYLHRPSGR